MLTATLKLVKGGNNSLHVTIPKSIIDTMKLQRNDVVEITIEKITI